MALKAVLNSLDGVPESLQSEYVERDGKFVLDVVAVDGYELDNTKGLKTALTTARAERDAAKKAESAVREKLGDRDLDEVLSAHERLSELGDDADIEKKVAELAAQREEKLTRKFEAEKKKTETQLGQAHKQLENLLKREAITRALTEAGGSRSLLLPVMESRVRMRQNDSGEYAVEVLDEDGQPAFSDSLGNPQTIPGLIQDLRNNTDYAVAFSGGGNRGTGRVGGDNTNNTKGAGNNGVPRTIARSDKAAQSKYLEEIASGEITIVDDGS